MSQVHVNEKEARAFAESARETEWKQPSFGRELFLGRFRPDLIHPHPKPSASERERGEAFLARFEQFLRENVDPLEIEAAYKIPDRIIDGLKELGAFGMKVPQEYGGLGLSQLYYSRAMMLAGSAHTSLSTLLSGHQSIGVPAPVRQFGTAEQKAAFLPRVARGEISAFLLTEPDVGSDPARVATRAELSADGSEYVIDGTKLWASNAVIADLIVVLARVPKAEGRAGGVTAFVVEMSTPGIEILNRNSFMGLRGIENALVRFTDVRVPVENRIGAEGMGLKIALTTLNTGRLALPAICAAATKWSLKIAREWASQRVQWGLPIGQHDAIAQKIGYIAGMAFALEAASELSSVLADEGRNDIRIEAAIAKLYASEHAWKVVDDLMQIRGGRGYETAFSLRSRGERPIPTEMVFRDTRVNRIFEGSTEIMHLLIARDAVDQHLAVAGDIIEPDVALKDKAVTALKAAKFYAQWFPKLAVGRGSSPASFREFGALATHMRFIERTSRKLARTTFYLMGRYQGGLEKKQAILGRIVDVGAELYVMAAAIVRAESMRTDGDADAATAAELADTFCRGARRRVDQLLHDVWANDDGRNHKVARSVLDGRYTWAERGILDLSDTGEPASGAPSSTTSRNGEHTSAPVTAGASVR